jgi:Fur family peroxide stress response transcriptional regulator
VKATRQLIEEKIRGAGLKITPQRFAVLSYLHRTSSHSTAEEIRATLNRRIPHASRATVYNALSALVDAHLVDEIHSDKNFTRYEARTEPHHHFLCRRCGCLEDLPAETIKVLPSIIVTEGYCFDEIQVTLRGLCASCAEAHVVRE